MRPTRTFTAVLIAGALLLLAPAQGWAASAKVTKACETFEELRSDRSALAAEKFNGSDWAKLGATFRKASKSAPKQVKGALAKIAKAYDAIGRTDTESEASAAANTQSYAKAETKFNTYYATNCASSGTTDTPGSGGGDGSVTLDGETTDFDLVQCFLQEQPSAGGGGKILLTGQGKGTNADGDEVILDFTRYDEDSLFEGDDISVDIGDPADPDVQLGAVFDTGTITRTGSTLSASNLELLETFGSPVVVSFELKC